MHEAVSKESHEWGGRNGFLAEVQLGYDLIVTRETGCLYQRLHCLLTGMWKPSRMRVVNGHVK